MQSVCMKKENMHIELLGKNYANKSDMNANSDPSSIVTVIGQSCDLSGIQWEMIVLWVGESETESSVFVGWSCLLLSLGLNKARGSGQRIKDRGEARPVT